MAPADFLSALLGTGDLPTPSEPDEAVRLVRFHHLEGLVLARDRARGAGGLPDGWAEQLEGVYRSQALRTTLVVEAGRRAAGVLASAGIDSVLFKGAALVADGTYADPGARRMDDADLLVPVEHAEAAVAALTAAGFEPVVPWTPELFGWSDALTFHDRASPGGLPAAVDLHWRVRYDALRFGPSGRPALWEGARDGTPAPEPHLVLVAEHVLKHLRYKIHLAAYGDLVRLTGRVEEWSRVQTLVRASRLEVGVRALLTVLASDLGAPVPVDAIRGAPARLTAELAPAALAGRVRAVEGRLAGIVHRWRMLGGPARIAEDALEAAFPPRAWLQARYRRAGASGWGRYVRDVAKWAVRRGRSPASPHQELFDPRSRE